MTTKARSKQTTKEITPMTEDIITSIRDSLPGYRAACDQIEDLKARIHPPVTAPVAISSIDAAVVHILGMLEAGESLDEDLVATLSPVVVQGQVVEVVRGALIEAQRKLEARRVEILVSSTDAILAGLHDALTRLVDEVNTLTPLDQIADQEAAFASQRLDDAQQLHALLPQYQTIRFEQLRIMRDRGEDFAAKTSIAAFIHNLEDVFPDWAVWLSHGHFQNRRDERLLPINPPWPHRSSSPEFLLWARQNGAELWVPGAEQYSECAAGLRESARLPREDLRTDEWVDPTTRRLSPRGRAAYMTGGGY